MRRLIVLLAATVALAGALGAFSASALAAGSLGTVEMFSADPPLQTPVFVTGGPDGNVWFNDLQADVIGKVDPAGEITQYTDPLILQPGAPAMGPDGKLWFTTLIGGAFKIARFDPETGTTLGFTDPAISQPQNIAAGPDGNMWFTNAGNHTIGRITTTLPAVVTEYSATPALVSPAGITPGPDGRMYFTDLGAARIGSISTDGAPAITVYGANPGIGSPAAIRPGLDGTLWFTDFGTAGIGNFTPPNTYSFPIFTPPLEFPADLTAGPDSVMWFTDVGTGSIGLANGGINSQDNDPLVFQPGGIVSGADGKLWFTDQGNDQIGSHTAPFFLGDPPASDGLLINPGFDNETPVSNLKGYVPAPGWITTPPASPITYATLPLTPLNGAATSSGVLWGGPSGTSSKAIQQVSVASKAAGIDAGLGHIGLSAELGGFGSQEDNAVVTASFLNAAQAPLGGTSIGPVTAADRANATKLLPRSTNFAVPAGTRAIKVTVTMTRAGGGGTNDGYADNIHLTLDAPDPPQPPPPPAPGPGPTGKTGKRAAALKKCKKAKTAKAKKKCRKKAAKLPL